MNLLAIHRRHMTKGKANEIPSPFRPGILAMMTIAEGWSSYLAGGFGLASAAFVAATAQVWGFPVPRGLLSSLAVSSFYLAWGWASFAVAFRIFDSRSAISAPPRSAAIYVMLVLAMLGYTAYFGVSLLRASSGVLHCVRGYNPKFCDASSKDAENLSFGKELRDYLVSWH